MKERKELERDYDLAATRERFIKSGRRARPFARFKGITEEGFSRFLGGSYVPKAGSPQEKVYLDALRSEGLLVLRDDHDQAACSIIMLNILAIFLQSAKCEGRTVLCPMTTIGR